MTTIKLSGGNLGRETMMIRCDLSQASAPIQVNYMNDGKDSPWQGTQYQCADARHATSGLINLGKRLAAEAVQEPEDEFDCDAEEV